MPAYNVVDELGLLREEINHVYMAVSRLDTSVQTLQASTAEVVLAFGAFKQFAAVCGKIMRATILVSKFFGALGAIGLVFWGATKAYARISGKI